MSVSMVLVLCKSLGIMFYFAIGLPDNLYYRKASGFLQYLIAATRTHHLPNVVAAAADPIRINLINRFFVLFCLINPFIICLKPQGTAQCIAIGIGAHCRCCVFRLA